MEGNIGNHFSWKNGLNEGSGGREVHDKYEPPDDQQDQIDRKMLSITSYGGRMDPELVLARIHDQEFFYQRGSSSSLRGRLKAANNRRSELLRYADAELDALADMIFNKDEKYQMVAEYADIIEKEFGLEIKKYIFDGNLKIKSLKVHDSKEKKTFDIGIYDEFSEVSMHVKELERIGAKVDKYVFGENFQITAVESSKNFS